MKSAQWSKNAFPPLTLSAEQQQTFRHLARGLVRETLGHFLAFDRLPRAEQDLAKHKRWKAVKTRDSLTVFKERDPPKTLSGTSFDTPERQRMAHDEWQMPKLLVGVGAIVGSLDDVMYGVTTPDAEAMLLKAAIVRSALVDGAVLAQIDGPTPEEPFRFLGVKWFVKGPPATLRGFVQPRDLVFVESTGVFTRSNGVRIGYQLLHSVDLDGYGPLAERSLTRGRISSCTIFRESQGGRRVDVYVRGYVEQHGMLLDSVALKAASTGFLSSWNAVECSHVKKLMWLLKNPHLVTWKEDAAARARGPDARAPARSTASSSFDGPSSVHLRNLTLASPNDRCGGTCGRKLKKAKSVGLCRVCSLCQVPMCAKCRVSKKLAYATSELKLERRESVICRSCVAKVRLLPVRRIAQQEIRHGRYRWRPSSKEQPADAAQAATPPSQSKPTSSSGTHFHFGGERSNASAAAGLLDRQQLQRTQAQDIGPDGRLVLPTKPRWFRRNKKSEQSSAESRPVVLGESTPLSDCQSGTLSQCSTAVDSLSTTSPINPLAYSWASSAQESEGRARVEEDDEDDWANTPELTENQQERRHLWHQMTELRLAVENTYQIAKHTTDSCCDPSFSPVGKTAAPY